MIKENFILFCGTQFVNHRKRVGVRFTNDWCKAIAMKNFWYSVVKKDILWVKWVHGMYLHDSSIWSYSPINIDSWLIKKIFRRWDLIRPHISWSLGYGKDTHLWLDLWISKKFLTDLVDEWCILYLDKKSIAWGMQLLMQDPNKWKANYCPICPLFSTLSKPQRWGGTGCNLGNVAVPNSSISWTHLELKQATTYGVNESRN